MHRTAGPELLAIGTDIDAAPFVPLEVRVGEGSVLALGPVPNGDVGRDLLVFYEPAEELARAIGRVSGEPLGLEIEEQLPFVLGDVRGALLSIIGEQTSCWSEGAVKKTSAQSLIYALATWRQSSGTGRLPRLRSRGEGPPRVAGGDTRLQFWPKDEGVLRCVCREIGSFVPN
jgi:hypothetical protein